jgi:hypothetical protein
VSTYDKCGRREFSPEEDDFVRYLMGQFSNYCIASYGANWLLMQSRSFETCSQQTRESLLLASPISLWTNLFGVALEGVGWLVSLAAM